MLAACMLHIMLLHPSDMMGNLPVRVNPCYVVALEPDTNRVWCRVTDTTNRTRSYTESCDEITRRIRAVNK